MPPAGSSARRSSGRSRATASRERREQILGAALEVFGENGLAGASIQEISRRARASVGSIYHHFGSKESLATALYSQAIADYQRGALEVLETAHDARAGIRGLVVQFLRWVGDHPQLAGLMLSVEHRDLRALAADEVAVLNREFLRHTRAWLRTYLWEGEPPVPEELYLHAVLGPARSYAGQWVAGRSRVPLEQAASGLADLAWAGVSGTRRRP